MGGGRAKATLVCLVVLALAAAGCGVEEHENAGRPQVPTRVSVAVTDNGVSVQPQRIAIGPEPTQQIPQNQNVSQPPVRSNAPLNVEIVAANLTDTDTELLVRGSGKDATLTKLVANGNGSLLTKLPTGVYSVTASGLPDATAGKLVVGPYRTSSQNDVLLP